jgi:subtilase family serine protease
VGPLAAAAYVATAWADDNNVIVESRETNNSREDSFLVAAPPDLIVFSLGSSPASPTTLDTITVTAVVKNVGTAQAGASTLSLKGDWESAPTTHVIPALAAGARSAVARTMGTMAAASYAVTAQADVNNAVAESNELNNGMTHPFVVVRPPDLIIHSLTHSPATPTMADYNSVTVVVQNVGVSTAGASTMSLLAAGYTTMHSIPVLAAGQTSTVTHEVGQLWAGIYSLSAKADVNNEVAESDETNNLASVYGWRVWPLPDLVVSSFSYKRVRIMFMDLVQLDAVVTNNGPAAAASSKILFLSGNIDSVLDVPALAAGESSPVLSATYALGIFTPGVTYYIYAWVDSAHTVTEWNEDNNFNWFKFIR